MLIIKKKTKSIVLMLLVFFSCASNPEYNYRLAKKTIEVLENNSSEIKEFYEAKYLFEQGLINYKKDKWTLANDYFIKSIEKAEYAEEKFVLYNK